MTVVSEDEYCCSVYYGESAVTVVCVVEVSDGD